MDSTTLDRSLLLDFFGDLLTEKQRDYCDLHWNEDYSLSEIAQLGGLTRQGVWDILRRAEQTLQDIESKTGLVRRHLERRSQIAALRRDLSPLLADDEKRRDILARLDELE